MDRNTEQEETLNRNRKIFIAGIVLVLLLLVMTACSGGSSEKSPESSDSNAVAGAQAETDDTENGDAEAGTVNDEAAGDEEEITMKMTINDTEVNVAWENNASVRALADLAKDGPVTIQMDPYGGFEQVGSIGATLPSNDTNIKTKAGDIMLYTSDHMVIFHGSNSWAYTRLGRITDKSGSELRNLLGGSGVTVTVTAD